MTEVQNDDSALVNWGAITTNVLALLIGTAVLGTFSGVGYLVFLIPKNQEKILENQKAAQIEQARTNTRLNRLEASDDRQNQILLHRNGK